MELRRWMGHEARGGGGQDVNQKGVVFFYPSKRLHGEAFAAFVKLWVERRKAQGRPGDLHKDHSMVLGGCPVSRPSFWIRTASGHFSGTV